MLVRDGIPYYAVESSEYSKRLRAMVNSTPCSLSTDLKADEANRKACLAQLRLAEDELDACVHREGKYANLTEDEHYDKLVELDQVIENLNWKYFFWVKVLTPPKEEEFLSADEREQYESICERCRDALWERRVFGTPAWFRIEKSEEELDKLDEEISFLLREKDRYELIRRKRYYAELDRRRREMEFGPEKSK